MADYVSVAKITDVPQGESRVFVVRGSEIAVFNVEGRFFALSNHCPHQGGPLVAGTLHEKTLTCPWHFWQFDLETGASSVNPSVSVATYPVRVEGDQIKIEWAKGSSGGWL
jgi:nitrite reductase (NADH) small subunit